MMKQLILTLAIVALAVPYSASAALIDNLRGRILLQVEQNGEAWYVNPVDDKRLFMGRPEDAFALMRELGLGITDKDLDTIPVGFESIFGQDSDDDGLADDFEKALGFDHFLADSDGDGETDSDEVTNGTTPRQTATNNTLVRKLEGRILLQVEGNGESWYLNPVDGKRYFLGRPADAFNIMRKLGLGITDANLETIKSFTLLEDFEQEGYFTVGVPINMTPSTEIAAAAKAALLENPKISNAKTAYFAVREDVPALGVIRMETENFRTLHEINLDLITGTELTRDPDSEKIDGYDSLVGIEMPIDEETMQITSIIRLDGNTFYILTMIINKSDRELYADSYYDQIVPSLSIVK